MAGYFDSSFMLGIILEDHPTEGLVPVWDDESVRLSSFLFKSECVIGIRRAGNLQEESSREAWVNHRLSLLSRYFTAMTMKIVDDSIHQVIINRAELAQCSTLDAVHLATALYFQNYSDDLLRVCSLDQRMRSVAIQLGFVVLPENLQA